MENENTTDSMIAGDLRAAKNETAGTSLPKIPGMGGFVDAADEFRQGKYADAAVSAAANYFAPFAGEKVLKVAAVFGIDKKVIAISVVFLLLFLSLVTMMGIYAITHKWELFKMWWFS